MANIRQIATLMSTLNYLFWAASKLWRMLLVRRVGHAYHPVALTVPRSAGWHPAAAPQQYPAGA